MSFPVEIIACDQKHNLGQHGGGWGNLCFSFRYPIGKEPCSFFPHKINAPPCYLCLLYNILQACWRAACAESLLFIIFCSIIMSLMFHLGAFFSSLRSGLTCSLPHFLIFILLSSLLRSSKYQLIPVGCQSHAFSFWVSHDVFDLFLNFFFVMSWPWWCFLDDNSTAWGAAEPGCHWRGASRLISGSLVQSCWCWCFVRSLKELLQLFGILLWIQRGVVIVALQGYKQTKKHTQSLTINGQDNWWLTERWLCMPSPVCLHVASDKPTEINSATIDTHQQVSMHRTSHNPK